MKLRRYLPLFTPYLPVVAFVLAGFIFAAISILNVMNGSWIGALVFSLPTLLFFTLAFLALRRQNLLLHSSGEGVVEIAEGQLIYFGSQYGQKIDLQDIQQIALTQDQANADRRYWVIETSDRLPLIIPTNAVGVEAMVDQFLTFPDFNADRVRDLTTKTPVVVWLRN